MREVCIRLDTSKRPYQQDLVNFFRAGGKRAIEVWHRKAGKDRVATFIESEMAIKRVGLYWHALPRYEEARKVIWDAITPDGKRLIDVNFPDEICRRKNAHEMKIELVNGSIWQPVGADNYDSLVGASPVHVTFSEFALMHPAAWQFIRPAIAQNDGSAMFITTPRGYNHAHELLEHAKADDWRTGGRWHWSIVKASTSGVLSREILDDERRTMPEELYRQEFECDFSAANVGAILGRYIEEAEAQGRVDAFDYDPDGLPIEISSDIGFRDTAAWWMWQPKPDGFALVDYDEDTGQDAEDWASRLNERAKKAGYPIGKIWLPHDAKAKTFSTKHSAVETFIKAFGVERIGVVPQSTKQDRINAARMVMPKCRFDRVRCKAGLAGLRAWAFLYDEIRKVYSREPDHDWASHPGDGFSYGAQVMQERSVTRPKVPTPFEQQKATMDDLWKWREEAMGNERP